MKKPSFCFISYTARIQRPILDGSTRYRCFHPADELRRLGFFSVVTSHAEFFKNPNFEYDVYVFHRPSRPFENSAKFDSIIKVLRVKKKILIADYDDLIFGEEELALQSSIVKNKNLSIEQATKVFSNNLAGLKVFDRVIASTFPLADMQRKYNADADIVVMPNFVPSSLLDLHETECFFKKERTSGTIGYFAGTKSHDKDILVVLEPLHRVLIENPEYKLVIVGPVQIPKALAALPNVVANPVVNYMRLPSLMSYCETVIAPLELSLFNDCKSRVKFLEAALSGCRLVATPITDMKAVGAEHIHLVENKGEWYDSLSLKPTESDLNKMRIKNFEYLKNNCSVKPLLELAGI